MLDGGESVGLTLAFRPSPNLIQIDNLGRSHKYGLFKALEVIVVVVPGKPILAGTTQTVALVQGTITNQVGKKVVSATDRMLLVTNAPWLFQGELVRITTTATSAFPVVCTGVTRD